jgi:hypothetical protein
VKREQVTDNVKLAWNAHQNVILEELTGVPGLSQLHDYSTASSEYSRTLEGAMELLHFAAGRAEYTTVTEIVSNSLYKDVVYRVIVYPTQTFPVGQPPVGEKTFVSSTTESLLHAVLLAVDEIVAARPEAFQ